MTDSLVAVRHFFVVSLHFVKLLGENYAQAH